MRETIYTPDTANKKMFVTREFDAPLPDVWRAWTESELLDQWWAPKPWKANTQVMDFREGGHWRYYMEGPDGTRHYCRADYYKIVPQRSYTGLDAFCDENGTIKTEFPRMTWQVEFNSSGSGTKVDITITFSSEADMNTIVEMGFKEGFAMAHQNLDELLKSNRPA